MDSEENKTPYPSEPQKRGITRGQSIFFLMVGGFSSILGFGYTYMNSKKSEVLDFTANSTPDELKTQMGRMKDGTKFASRAFALSWLISISSVSLISYGVWKWSGATSTADFRECVGNKLPRISQPGVTGRSDFKSLRDLADYLEEEDRKNSTNKQSNDSTR